MKCSVLVNTAHRPENLNRCIASYYEQSCMEFEMVIADDGSDENTLSVILDHKKHAPFSITHVWHPSEGHRRAEILNKGIAACNTDYILFTDCDALAPACFVATHLNLRRPARMLIGGQVKLSREQTEVLTLEEVRSHQFEDLITEGDRRKLRRQHFKNLWHIWIRKRRRPHNLGLNMSLELEGLLKVNGYDQMFRGWGNADGDLRERLKKIGIHSLSVWSKAIIFHQWHPPLKRGKGNASYARRSNIPFRAENGLSEAHREYEENDKREYQNFCAGL
jgi:glycosyltransferase involved in cell wall biosynthesis